MQEPEPVPSPTTFAVMAVVVQGGIALAAVVVGWLLGYPPGDAVVWHWDAALWGLVAALPLLVLFGTCLWVPWKPLRDVLRLLDQLLAPLIQQHGLLDIALLSALAGLSEEMLFRGVLQRAMAGADPSPLRQWIALGIAAALFGFAHNITRAYALLATLAGAYLGWLWIATGNILVPAIAHALYDFLALVYLVRIRRRDGQAEDS